MNPTQPKRLAPAAQYLRMSTDKQRYSIEAQSSAIAAYAEAEGFEIVQTYKDEARSGVTITGRDGLQTLLRDVLSGAAFSTILVLDVSRWGRYQNPDQAAHYEFLCFEAGVKVRYCADGMIDDGSPTSALLKSIKRVMAGEYSRQLSDRCRSALRRHVMAGAKHGGVAPYGFARQIFNADGSPGRCLEYGERRGPYQVVRLVHGPASEADIVRDMFKWFAEARWEPKDIAKHLNATARPFRDGSAWTTERVRRILRNEIAVGRFVFNRTYCRFGERKAVPRDDWKRVEVAPALIPLSLFDAAQARFTVLHGASQTDADMIRDLQQLLAANGNLTPRMLDHSKSTMGQKAYIRRFGSIEAAWAQVPFTGAIPRRRILSAEACHPDEILRQLKLLLAEMGYLSTRNIHRSPNLPTPRTIGRIFGSLSLAYELAGYVRTQGEMVSGGRKRASLLSS